MESNGIGSMFSKFLAELIEKLLLSGLISNRKVPSAREIIQ